MAKSGQTPSQTIGPFFAYGLVPEQYGYAMSSIASANLRRSDTEGHHIRIEGRVFDGEGKVVPDALIEIWQADATGRYAHPADPRGSNAAFKGFGRCGTGTDPESRFIFETIKPATVHPRECPAGGRFGTGAGSAGECQLPLEKCFNELATGNPDTGKLDAAPANV